VAESGRLSAAVVQIRWYGLSSSAESRYGLCYTIICSFLQRLVVVPVVDVNIYAHVMGTLGGRGVIWRLSMNGIDFIMTHLHESIVHIPLEPKNVCENYLEPSIALNIAQRL
jgi:hypothetical protein